MTQTTEAELVVSQEAREAAAEMWRASHLRPETEWQSDWMLNGTADEGPVVQAFQRAMTQAYRRGVEDAAKVADDLAEKARRPEVTAVFEAEAPGFAMGAETVAATIRNLTSGERDG